MMFSFHRSWGIRGHSAKGPSASFTSVGTSFASMYTQDVVMFHSGLEITELFPGPCKGVQRPFKRNRQSTGRGDGHGRGMGQIGVQTAGRGADRRGSRRGTVRAALEGGRPGGAVTCVS